MLEGGIASVELVPEVPSLAEGLAYRVRERGTHFGGLQTSHCSCWKSWQNWEASSRHLKKVVDEIAERVEGGGVVRVGWVKTHTGIPGNEAAEGVPLDEKSPGGGIKQWTKQRERERNRAGVEAQWTRPNALDVELARETPDKKKWVRMEDRITKPPQSSSR